MITKKVKLNGVERTVYVFPFDEYEGIKGSDDLIDVFSPDRRVFIRDGIAYVYSDEAYALG